MNDMMNMTSSYKTQYKCYSVSMMAGNEREDVEKGGKSKLFWEFCKNWAIIGTEMP